MEFGGHSHRTSRRLAQSHHLPVSDPARLRVADALGIVPANFQVDLKIPKCGSVSSLGRFGQSALSQCQRLPRELSACTDSRDALVAGGLPAWFS